MHGADEAGRDEHEDRPDDEARRQNAEAKDLVVEDLAVEDLVATAAAAASGAACASIRTIDRIMRLLPRRFAARRSCEGLL
jgi:hypothetical protein